MDKNINMENNNRCFAHFEKCKCSEDANPARVRFSDLTLAGLPICNECGEDLVLVGVEIIEK